MVLPTEPGASGGGGTNPWSNYGKTSGGNATMDPRASGNIAAPKPTGTVSRRDEQEGQTRAGALVNQSGPTGGNTYRNRYPRSNPPLHPLTESTFTYGRDSVGLRRGAIVQMRTNAGDPKTKVVRNPYIFRFLFNPNEIGFGNQFTGTLMPTEYRNPQDNGAMLLTGQESVSFSLLLDRTQEAYEQGIRTRGTLDDVEALYRVINGDVGSRAGYLSLSAVEIQWGPTLGNSAHPLPPFPCYITNISVTHTVFTPRMTPIRTALSISAARLMNTASSTANSSSLSGAS